MLCMSTSGLVASVAVLAVNFHTNIVAFSWLDIKTLVHSVKTNEDFVNPGSNNSSDESSDNRDPEVVSVSTETSRKLVYGAFHLFSDT